jgi:hypothetical protein
VQKDKKLCSQIVLLGGSIFTATSYGVGNKGYAINYYQWHIVDK